MSQPNYVVTPIGLVHSTLTSARDAPKQGDEGAPAAWIELLAEYAAAARSLQVGDQLMVLTWLHEARRDLLEVHPRDDPAAPLTGVFRTRSADRPNPIGLHSVTLLRVDGLKLLVAPIEAIDGTPVLDIKPALTSTRDGIHDGQY